MPTNVTRPVWQCDTCGTTHGERLDLAELCEQAPAPGRLPDGTPVLGVDRHNQFVLHQLTATDKVTTEVTDYRPKPGHHRVYRRAVPAGGTIAVDDSKLWPNEPGFLQVDTDTGTHFFHGIGNAGIDLEEVARNLGLGQPGSKVLGGPGVSSNSMLDWHHRVLRVVEPITPEVRAVFDHLGAHLPFHDLTRPWGRPAIGGYLMSRAGGFQQANWFGRLADLDALYADQDARQRMWLAGHLVDRPVPYPFLEARSTKTPSKLNGHEKALVAATGVEWDARTTASEYCRKLVRRRLTKEVPMPTSLFAGPKIIAVGGVKGGTGKSTTAAALASRMAADGLRVLLLDADLNGPSQHLIWNLGPVRVSDDLTRIVAEPVTDRLSVFSVGQLAGSGKLPVRWGQGDALEFLRFLGATLDVEGFDVLVVDLPAGTENSAELFLGHRETDARAEKLVVVTNADPLALSDAEGHLRPRLHERWRPVVVENLAYATGSLPDGTTATVRIRGDGTEVPALAEKHRARFAGSFPWAGSVAELAATPEVGALAAILLEDA